MSIAKDKAIWAFDFDGVVCDSCGESSVSAWKASAKYWPQLFSETSITNRYEEIIDKMHQVRPVIETGYENLVQVRCLLENFSVEDMLKNWHTILPQQMEKWQLDRQTLIKAFGDTRDEWIENDFDGWLQANKIYPGVLEPLRKAIDQHECYIVTTKQERYAHAILSKMANIDMPQERLISTTMSGIPKYEILLNIEKTHTDKTMLNFVEDKFGTLLKVIKNNKLDKWKLYLVDWGYNTDEERTQASQQKRIQIVNKDKFATCLGELHQ